MKILRGRNSASPFNLRTFSSLQCCPSKSGLGSGPSLPQDALHLNAPPTWVPGLLLLALLGYD